MPTDLTVLTRAALAAILALACAMPLHAQPMPDRDDLQALRFYLREDNTLAIASEVRRLQQTFPGWTPPEDLESLLESDIGPAVDRIYGLIADGAFDEARALIAETETATPSWSPPQEMTDLLRLGEAQRTFDAAVSAQQAEVAIDIARAIPELIACERVNNAWLLAEMHVLLDNPDEARQIYSAVVQTCRDPDLLVPTLEKADTVTDLAQLATLSDAARARAPEAAARLRAVEDRLRAGRGVAARWGDGDMVIALTDDIIELEDRVTGAAPQPAPPQRSLRPAPRPGALQTAGRTPPPQPVRVPAAAPPQRTAPAPAAAAPAATAGISAIQAAANAGNWSRCLALSNGSRAAAVVFQRGWCAYNANRSMEAVIAFRDARTRLPNASQRRDAGYGLMLSLLRLNMTEEAATHAAALPLTREQRVEVESQILDQRGVRAYQRGQYRRAVAFFDEHRRLTGIERRDLMLLKGYALLNSGNRAEALALFERLHDQLATPETRSALRAAR